MYGVDVLQGFKEAGSGGAVRLDIGSGRVRREGWCQQFDCNSRGVLV